MTNWIPNIPAGKGPMYLRLANQIAEDIVAGTLPAGAKLPPQRDLAYDLGITVGTVGRAYALVREKGLVSGEVGRGTYVLGTIAPVPEIVTDHSKTAPAIQLIPAPVLAGDVDFGSTRTAVPHPELARLDSTSAPEIGQSEIVRNLMQQITRDSPYEIASYTRIIPDSWRQAGQRWLARGGWTPDPGSIVPAFGAQAAIMSVISATTSPGDRIVFEELTYSSIARGAVLMGRQPVAVARDERGPLPDELAKICAQKHPKVIFMMPTMHNPTLTTMPEDRRREIIAVAREHNLWIIEDEVYGSLRDTELTPLIALAPERTFHVGSLSKTVAAGLRGGWVSSPLSHAQRIANAHKMMTGGISFLLAELSARLVLSGAADDLRLRILAEIDARHDIMLKEFQGLDFESAKDSPFLWLKLPEPWLPGTFKAAAASAKVLIDDEDEFKTGRPDRTHHRVRMGFTNPLNRAEVAASFATLKNLLDDGIAAYDSFE
ncbi:PLP-dependent aminotransferase family protein [uncultured Roseibium sp.]|uniref:aminotransferase-like domain-containing protein n=1 Tax=uncultured Roseibium sp. TaxID=1936171 RepID=UPI00259376F1|nr:PLP-dependent aminotransferase family protein [uncultured Roseibium sp.]